MAKNYQTIINIEDEATCAICLETPMVNPEEADPCKHRFCKDCLAEVLRSCYPLEPTCPLCRSVLKNRLEQPADTPINNLEHFRRAILNNEVTLHEIHDNNDDAEGVGLLSGQRSRSEERPCKDCADILIGILVLVVAFLACPLWSPLFVIARVIKIYKDVANVSCCRSLFSIVQLLVQAAILTGSCYLVVDKRLITKFGQEIGSKTARSAASTAKT